MPALVGLKEAMGIRPFVQLFDRYKGVSYETCSGLLAEILRNRLTHCYYADFRCREQEEGCHGQGVTRHEFDIQWIQIGAVVYRMKCNGSLAGRAESGFPAFCSEI
jgi:hypothetical protein